MTEPSPPQDKTEASRSDQKIECGAKKPYQKPTFQYERVFETMALACGKVSPTQAQCRFNRKNS